jgi:hypothetical protein
LFFRKSDIKKSTEYLTKYLQKVADKEGDVQYARACSALGFIHNTLVKTSPGNFHFYAISNFLE